MASRKTKTTKKRGPKPERLIIDPKDVGDVLKGLLGPKPQKKPKKAG